MSGDPHITWVVCLSQEGRGEQNENSCVDNARLLECARFDEATNENQEA